MAGETIALTGGMVIDGRGGDPIPAGTVLVEGNAIRAVGPADNVAVPEGATVVDVGGRTILPGLIDSHVHVVTSGGGFADPEEFKPSAFAATLRSFLLFGVTSVMDMTSNPDLDTQKANIAAGRLVGPRLFGVKYGITAPGSHPTGLMEEFHVMDKLGPYLPLVTTPDEARAAVQKVAADNTDGIKIYHSRSEFPGTMCLDADRDKLKPDVLAALIDEAHAHGKRVYAHIAWPSEAREVVEAGVDALAHPVTHAETGVDAIMETMAERGTYMHTTMVRMEAYFALKVDPFMADDLRGRVSDVVLNSITMPKSVVRARHRTDGVTEDARRILAITMANVRRANKAGVKIAMGTDSGGACGLHGAGVAREMELLNLAGLTPMQVIEASTRTASEVIGQADRLGTLEPGKLADIIVVDGDPLRDISNIRNLHLVIKDGTVIEPASIAFH